jgi:hypothetical protein
MGKDDEVLPTTEAPTSSNQPGKSPDATKDVVIEKKKDENEQETDASISDFLVRMNCFPDANIVIT